MKNIVIRPATLIDLDQLSNLFDCYRIFYKKASDLEAAKKFIEARIRGNDSIILVAQDSKSSLLGFVQIYPTFSSLSLCRTWVLNDLYVDKEFRRCGIAKMLTQAVHALARKEGIGSIHLETQKDNAKAQALYSSLGYKIDDEFYMLDCKM